MPEFPIVDEAGEVLAGDEAERRQALAECGHALAAESIAKAEAKDARARLPLLARVGDVVQLGGGWVLRVDPPATPQRQVIPHKLDEHVEALTPIGLAPKVEEVTKVEQVRTDPGVADLTSPKARDALARAGLSAEVFLHTPEPGRPRVVLVEPERP